MNDTATITTTANLFKDIVTSGRQSQAEKDWYNLKQDRLYLIRVTRYLRGKLYESFLKLGWSTEYDLQKRFNWMPATFKIELIDTITLPKSIAHQTELNLHRFYKAYRYVTRTKFSGKNEAYTMHLLDEGKTLQELIDNIDSQQILVNNPYSLN
jgi:hypothetical protein